MTQFFNAKETIVTEAVDGLVALSGGRLARLDGYPHIRVVVRTDWDRSRVALVSGGGSGHEPAHAGFVGPGMLTAAVCGDVFASPSVDAVLAGILAVTGPAGCLLIVKNYTGDRLNFGLAAERARAFGLKVSMVIVDDDIAQPDLPQARGLAGTLFVHKIAGALAEDGADLDTVTAAARRIIAATRTIGMSLDTCTVPGSPKEARIPARQGRARPRHPRRGRHRAGRLYRRPHRHRHGLRPPRPADGRRRRTSPSSTTSAAPRCSRCRCSPTSSPAPRSPAASATSSARRR